MSALALFASVAVPPSFWFFQDVATQTKVETQDKIVQTDPCPFQTIGYAVLRRCPEPRVVWNYIDTTPVVLDCGVCMSISTPNKPWILSFKRMQNSQ